jgi:membrane-bound lytic murein transglycosylase B
MPRRKKIVALSALLFAGCCAVVFVTAAARQRVAAFAPGESGEKKAVKLFSEHRKWTRVNPERARMDAATSALCRAVMPGESGVGSFGPHGGKYISVYVNDAGVKTMTREKGTEFPPGSIIVKEKFATRAGGDAELMTAMVKREAGFNPESGDWEYFVLNGAGTQVQARGKLENCMACHVPRKDWDYTFRTYLPPPTP